MQIAGIETVKLESPIEEILLATREHHRQLVVVIDRDGRTAGVLTVHDIVDQLLVDATATL